MDFPSGKRFAFTILDDTDDSTLENVRPVYERLQELGLRTTKTVWPLDCPEGSRNFFAADTLQREEYLAFVAELLGSGFEIAFHGATMESSPRERTLHALDFLEQRLGCRPRLHANHGENRENLYWGIKRFRPLPLQALLGPFEPWPDGHFVGDVEGSPYFWGDVCRDRFDYVRGFTFRELDMRRINPEMPYSSEATPWVRGWFSTTDAPDLEVFTARLIPEALDRLERQGGVCIISTHLGKGFAPGGVLDPRADAVLTDIARRPGWFVPVSTLLDHMQANRMPGRISPWSELRLELRFLWDQLRGRSTSTER